VKVIGEEKPPEGKTQTSKAGLTVCESPTVRLVGTVLRAKPCELTATSWPLPVSSAEPVSWPLCAIAKEATSKNKKIFRSFI
jgi:hypothetical protein